jgi:hypothetical protein
MGPLNDESGRVQALRGRFGRVVWSFTMPRHVSSLVTKVIVRQSITPITMIPSTKLDTTPSGNPTVTKHVGAQLKLVTRRVEVGRITVARSSRGRQAWLPSTTELAAAFEPSLRPVGASLPDRKGNSNSLLGGAAGMYRAHDHRLDRPRGSLPDQVQPRPCCSCRH